jgi:hypothetical protein
MAVLINASNTRARTILSNSYFNRVKFNILAISSFIFCVCIVYTPASSVSDSGGVPLKAPQITDNNHNVTAAGMSTSWFITFQTMY